jgi:hypothetical protein
LLEGRRQTTDEFNSLKAKILDGLSIPLAVTEKYNRATTAIAAYDLAKQSGMNENDAVQYALTTVKDVHTSGLAATGPKWMQTGLGRMFFTFKSFVWNSAFIMARAFHQAYAGESPAVRKAAQRQLLGTVGMATAFAGAKGLPFYGVASTISTMIAALFGDDDEPFDFDTEIEPMLNVLVRKTLEQARMLVLEDEELRIMKDQQKEYEEIRNAELIEAQRLEAAEIRRKQELDRRKIQQKARKEERKAAHKKYVARVLAK